MPEQPKRRKPTKRRPKNQTADQVVADQVRRLRERRGITQQELADKLGWPQSTIARLELGNRSISVSDLLALCWALDVAPVYMLDGSFQTGDVPVHAGLRVATKHMREWICGGEPLPGSNYRAYFENTPDDVWIERYGPIDQQRRTAATHYERAETVLATGAARAPGAEDETVGPELEAELEEERRLRQRELDAARRAKQPRKRKTGG